MNVVETGPNIRRAIQRSQLARNAFNRRRRRTAIVFSALIAATIPASLAILGVGSSDMARAAQSGAKSLAELLGQRSPGERTQAELTKMKKTRALAKVRHAAAPAVKGPSPLTLARILLPPVEDFPVDLGNPMVTAQAPRPLSFYVSPPPGAGGGGIVTPPGAGGGGIVTPPGPGGGGTVVTPPGEKPPGDIFPPRPSELVVPPPAVPEPGTWAMMLLGFGLMGWSLRRDRVHRAPICAA